MIYKRFVANLRAQNWFAIGVELAIVVVGVFIGTQVSNWNTARLERAETEQVLAGLRPELQGLVEAFGTSLDYYAVTRRYGTTAFAGWRGDPGVDDKAFVIAAYQASQTTWGGQDAASWSGSIGSERLRDIADPRLRQDLRDIITIDQAAHERELFTDYRMDVRKVIPEDLQDAIRARCGDVRIGPRGFVRLPPTCTLALPEARFREAASELRRHPELVGEMRWHFAAIANYCADIENYRQIAQRALDALTRRG